MQACFIVSLCAVAVLLCCALGCGAEAGTDRSDAGSSTDAGVPYLAVLQSPADFDRLAESASGSGGETHVVKYLARIDGNASRGGLLRPSTAVVGTDILTATDSQFHVHSEPGFAAISWDSSAVRTD